MKHHFDSISIQKAMANIESNAYLLPAIQRKFVWRAEQIENLFDSILRGYPINSLMLWRITDEKIKQNYNFYYFLRNFTEKFGEKNESANTVLLKDFWAVIDGQQRLTSLYVGLTGTYRYKKPSKWWKDTEDAMPTRRLYLDLTAPRKTEADSEKYYNFVFLTDGEVAASSTERFWFPVGDILGFRELSDVNQYLIQHQLFTNAFAMKTLSNLYSRIHTEELIHYCMIEDQDQDKVLEVFIRANSGGTPLSFSDLLMSIASANWTRYDAREEMESVRREIFLFGNPNFNVSQDFILKSILMLSEGDIGFKLANFGRADVAAFEENWDKIKAALVATFELLEQLGFNDSVLRAKNAAIPIAYYIYKHDLAQKIVKSTYDKQEKKKIAKWLTLSLLKGIFGGHSDGVLTTIRKVLRQDTGEGFPYDALIGAFRADVNKNYELNDEIIEALLSEQYGTATCGLVLRLLYPEVVMRFGRNLAEDHMHPKTVFADRKKLEELGLEEERKKLYLDHYNTVLNLQLLEELENKSKGDTPLSDWARDQGKTHRELCVEQGVGLELDSFVEFINSRKVVLSQKLKELV